MRVSKPASQHPDCLGVVLAGGLSSRMGQDKAQLQRIDQDMLSFSSQLLRDAGLQQVVISGDRHQVADIVSQAGPVGGIYSVIERLQPKALLVLPVDLPLMTSAALQRLKTLGELSGKACFYQQHQLPLYLPVNGFVELYLQRTFSTLGCEPGSIKGPAMKALLAQVPHLAIEPTQPDVLFNSNTPQQWQQAQQKFNAF